MERQEGGGVGGALYGHEDEKVRETRQNQCGGKKTVQKDVSEPLSHVSILLPLVLSFPPQSESSFIVS